VKNGIIIFSDYNLRAVVALLRTLRDTTVPHFIIARGNDDLIFLTDYKHLVIAVLGKYHLDIRSIRLISRTVIYKYSLNSIYIMPTSEFLIELLLENRLDLEKDNTHISLIDKAIYEKLSNKFSFKTLVNTYGLNTPKEFEIDKIDTFPVVVKPKRYFDSMGVPSKKVEIIQNSQQLKDFKRKLTKHDDYFIQEFVAGRSFYLLFYIDKYGIVSKFSQENILQQSNGKHIILAKSSDLHEKEIATSYSRLLISLNFRGLIMIELIKRDNIYYMIEANPRLWGPSQLFVDSGVNLFLFMLKDYGFTNVNLISGQPIETYYFYYLGYLEQLEYFKKVFSTVECEKYIEFDIYNRTDTLKLFNKLIGDFNE